MRSSTAARPGGLCEEKPPQNFGRYRLEASEMPASNRIAARYHKQSLTSFGPSFHNQPPASLQARSTIYTDHLWQVFQKSSR